MFIYKGKEYKSRSEVIREMFDNGLLSLEDVAMKKEVAKDLGMTLSAVHITLTNYIISLNNEEPVKTKKISLLEVQTFGSEEVIDSPNKICVNFAPNPWGLPITNPPMFVIDEKYDSNWKPESEEQVERIWE